MEAVRATSMGKADSRARAPPVADYRKQTGRHQAKLGKAERTETHARAVQKKQEIDVRTPLLFMVIFGTVSALLYLYLAYVLEDDELEGSEM